MAISANSSLRFRDNDGGSRLGILEEMPSGLAAGREHGYDQLQRSGCKNRH